MKVLSTNLNYNYPIYSQNQNRTQENINFGAKLVSLGNISRYEILDPKSAILRKKFLETKFGRACGKKLIDFFEKAFLEKVSRQKKQHIYVDFDEQKKLSGLIDAAANELGISDQKNARVEAVLDNTFDRKWKDKKTACAKLKSYVEKLIEDAELVGDDVFMEFSEALEKAMEPVRRAFRQAMVKRPEVKT
jgi:hypothetical protein